MREGLAIGLVVVDEVDFPAHALRHPDRGGIVHTKVPCREHGRGGVIGHAGDASLVSRPGKELAVVGPDHGRVEVAHVFLPEQRLAVLLAVGAVHLLADFLHLLRREHGRFRHREALREPAFFSCGVLVERGRVVPPARGEVEDGPSAVFFKYRFKDAHDNGLVREYSEKTMP